VFNVIASRFKERLFFVAMDKAFSSVMMVPSANAKGGMKNINRKMKSLLCITNSYTTPKI